MQAIKTAREIEQQKQVAANKARATELLMQMLRNTGCSSTVDVKKNYGN